MASTKIEISIKTILTILVCGLILFVLSRTTDILTQIFIAFIIMTALNPLVSRIQKLHLSRTVAIMVTYFVFLVSLIVIFAAMVPAVIDQTTRLFVQLNLPSQPLLTNIGHLQFTVSTLTTLISTYGGSLGKAFEFVSSTFSGLFTFFTILVMALYFMFGRDQLYTYFTILFKTADKRDRSKHMVSAIESALGSWVRAQFILMLAIGVMSFIGLSILNIPYALPIAIFSALMEGLPNIGPTLAAIPAVLVALISVSPIMAGVTAVLYMLIQQVEINYVVPQVMKHATGIRPVTVLVLILLGFRFGGVIGALLSIPIYIVAKEVFQEFSGEIDGIVHES